MKMNETRRVLYDAVSGIDDALVQEATTPMPGRILRTLIRVAAAAAVLALLIGAAVGLPGAEAEYVTGPGLLSIRAYALDEDQISDIGSTVLDEGVELPWEYVYSPGINIVRGLPLKLDFPASGFEDMHISLDVRVSGGHFYLPPRYVSETYKNIGSEFTIENNQMIYWACDNKHESTYVDVIIRVDRNIIGYAVIEFYEALPEGQTEPIEGMHFGYLTRVIEIVSFPKVDGHLQPVTEKYVNKKIEELHHAD